MVVAPSSGDPVERRRGAARARRHGGCSRELQRRPAPGTRQGARTGDLARVAKRGRGVEVAQQERREPLAELGRGAPAATRSARAFAAADSSALRSCPDPSPRWARKCPARRSYRASWRMRTMAAAARMRSSMRRRRRRGRGASGRCPGGPWRGFGNRAASWGRSFRGADGRGGACARKRRRRCSPGASRARKGAAHIRRAEPMLPPAGDARRPVALPKGAWSARDSAFFRYCHGSTTPRAAGFPHIFAPVLTGAFAAWQHPFRTNHREFFRETWNRPSFPNRRPR